MLTLLVNKLPTMSKKTYFSQYKSPNIVIVPTVSLCNSSPSKKAKLEDTTNLKTIEKVSCSKQNTNSAHETLMKQAEQSKMQEIVRKETMPSSKKITNQLPEILMKQAEESVKIEKNISTETNSSPGKTTDPEPKIVMKLTEEFKYNDHMETVENIIKNNKNTMPSTKKMTNQLQVEEPKNNNNMKIDKNIRKDTTSEKSVSQVPNIVSKQIDESEDKNNKKKNNTSWASNYMQSIGQIHKKTTRITLNHLKTQKKQKIDDVSLKTNEGAKTMKQIIPNEVSKDKKELTPQMSTQLPQKPRKCKKIKLEITVVFQEPTLSSSDTDSNDENDEDESYVHADMSFLEDINVDEIVKSLCENISTKKEEGSCKTNEKFEENNNTKSNEVSKENKNRIDCIDQMLLIPSEKIKIEQTSPVFNNNKKECLQSKDNKLHVNIKTDQTPSIKLVATKVSPLNSSLKLKPDNAKENVQKSVTKRDDAKKRRLTPKLVITPGDARERCPASNLSVTSEDDKKRPLIPRPVIKPAYTKGKHLTPSLVNKSVDAKKTSPIPIPSIKSEEEEEEKSRTPYLIIKKDNEIPVPSSLVTKQDDAKNILLIPMLVLTSEDAKIQCPNPNVSDISEDVNNSPLNPSLVIKAACAKEKPVTPSVVIQSVDVKAKPLASCIVLQQDDAKEMSPFSSIKSKDAEVKPLSPYLMITKDETKEKPLTTSLETKSDDAKQKLVTQKFTINSENTNVKSQSPNRAIKPNSTKNQQLNTSPIIKLDHAKEKPLTPKQPRTPCLPKNSDNNGKPVISSLVTKPNDIRATPSSPRLDIKPEDAKEKPLIPSQPQTTSLSINSDKAKSKPQNSSSLTHLDKVLAENLETRLFQYLNEKFTVISNIHKGKYSKIYHTIDSKKKNYAVKILNNACDRFTLGLTKENMLIKLQRGIPRDNLQFVYVHNGFSMKGYWCFLMDFYPKNLHQALQENAYPFHIDKVQNLARQLVTAVTILRNNNIVHADIKPGHILLNCANDTLKVCGFDGSYFINAVNLLPNIGTVNYRAPEIIIGHSAGYSIDVWATALVMFEMATNSKLFPGTFNNDILYKQICTLGTIPYHMVQKSLFRDNHFHKGKFIRRVGYSGQKTIILDQFFKNNKLQNGIFNAYQFHWCKKRSRAQQEADLKKLGLFHLLLEQMLVLNPNCRLAIEFVYANPFIYEFC